MKEKFERVAPPTMPAKNLLGNNWFLIKLVFRSAPVAMSIYAFEQFRVTFMIFFEHTWLIKTVLDCIQ
ncbi:MAG: hypothetical protein IJQ80_03520, partial [Clostridia bacterium]|nr:hypothetical protein [Clostridia bacterium]